ncbi:MAG: ABC transporter substrate-binding protein [Proteobacteria bacterium]|nr:MAG: ABC transporter substrate-binding protein [Pseudomonadota bacterium]
MRTPCHLRLLVLLLPALLAPFASGAAETVRVHGLAMHGAPKYGPDFRHFDYVNPDAPKGGTVRLASIGSFDSLNPFIIKGEAADGIGSLYDSLTTASADEPFTRYGLLAESMELAADRSWIIFTLRQEARWHDGKPVTADDVIFTFETIRRDGAPQLKYYYTDIRAVEKLGTHRVKFTFANGENRELPLIVGEQAILPKHFWEGREFNKTSLEPPLGSGAYKIDSLEPGRFIVYRRVDDYWGKSLPVNIGQDNYDVIRYDYYRDATVVIEAFKAGEFDFRNENSSKHWATAYEIPEVADKLMVKAEIGHDRPAGMQGYVYNTRRPLFQDARVREALAYAFDFERSNQTLFYGQYTRTRSYFQNSELEAKGTPSPAELQLLEPYRDQLPRRVFTEEYQPPGTDGSGRIRENLRIAVNLLKEAGWSIQEGKLRNAAGDPFEFEIMLVSPLFERITLPFIQTLERLGITARVRTIDTAQYIKRLETFDFDLFVFVWGQSLSPGNEQHNFWSSPAAEQPGSRNFAGIKNPAVDALIDLIVKAPDRESLVTRVRALDRVLQWGFYVIPHWHIDYDRLVYWNKFGRPEITPLQGAQFNTWWVDPVKEARLKGRIKSVAR